MSNSAALISYVMITPSCVVRVVICLMACLVCLVGPAYQLPTQWVVGMIVGLGEVAPTVLRSAFTGGRGAGWIMQ
jgi:hypothetical protein